jgi:hypothetical protein
MVGKNGFLIRSEFLRYNRYAQVKDLLLSCAMLKRVFFFLIPCSVLSYIKTKQINPLLIQPLT